MLAWLTAQLHPFPPWVSLGKALHLCVLEKTQEASKNMSSSCSPPWYGAISEFQAHSHAQNDLFCSLGKRGEAQWKLKGPRQGLTDLQG